jgi:hypothetical protein
MRLGDIVVDLPDTHLGIDRQILVTLCFGQMELIATAKNQTNGKIYRNTFKYHINLF